MGCVVASSITGYSGKNCAAATFSTTADGHPWNASPSSKSSGLSSATTCGSSFGAAAVGGDGSIGSSIPKG